MDGACDMYGRQERCVRGFGWETQGTRPLRRFGVDGRTIGKWFFKKWDRETWIGLI